MNFELKALALPQAATEKCDLLVLLVGEGFVAGSDPLSALVAHALKHQDLEPQPGKLLELYQLPAVAARRVLLAGCGNGSAKAVRQALLACAGAFKAAGVAQALVCFAHTPSAAALTAAVQAVADASYVYTATKPQAKAPALVQVVLAVPEKKSLQAAFAQGQALAAGVALAREWANRPANHATPTLLAQAAQALAGGPIECQVMERAALEKLGMGAFLAVAQGSAEPLRFIELRYQGAGKKEAPVVLVGKGITFDTGGISLKPAAEMDEMKFDMGGAASVLGVFQALALLQPQINVVGLIAATENMPGGQAVKPGDVVTSMSGQTIEILNTDAEGRLVLCDALTYAARFKPRAIIDIATLTGACVIALGGVRSGLFASCDTLAGSLQAAGDAALDPCWRLPLDDDYAEGLKSHFADLANVGGRPAGAVTAAKFLQRFVGDTPWAHLDIAGTAWKSGAAKGGTGRPVGLLLQYLLDSAAVGKAAKPKGNPKAKPKAKAQ
ncbi:leucyl aminopeptidase [Acidovorax sp. HDW3]|uniref:leucyl aminopeptidase n=1 Tax=Acidovorax sp. HDW3 TaxID=2714923 RepID=UPI001409254C|nr:leucyl aminopeptidase [Acidovorax sp. HDW3]QIL43982.1 leucyl aminopeptidase [Acidovorax sp. HDW3]